MCSLVFPSCVICPWTRGGVLHTLWAAHHWADIYTNMLANACYLGACLGTVTESLKMQGGYETGTLLL